MSSRRRDARNQSQKTTRVLICNRYKLFRDGIRALLQQSGGIEIVGETNTAKQAIDLAQQLKPDVVLLDATTPGLSASSATRRIKQATPSVNILIVSLDDDETLASLCLKAGASGHIGKHGKSGQLTGAIDAACRKRTQAA